MLIQRFTFWLTFCLKIIQIYRNSVSGIHKSQEILENSHRENAEPQLQLPMTIMMPIPVDGDGGAGDMAIRRPTMEVHHTMCAQCKQINRDSEANCESS